MPVHAPKGLEAPVVILPESLQLPRADAFLLWVDDGKAAPPLALWPVKSEYDLPVLAGARAARRTIQEQEYRRLLYVALTRAEDRLYLCGWETKNTAPAGNWLELTEAALARLAGAGSGDKGGAEAIDFDFTAELGGDGWSGRGWRLTRPPRAPVAAEKAQPVPVAAAPVTLPDWARQSAAQEPAPPQPLAPSRPTEAEQPSRSHRAAEIGRASCRGRVYHHVSISLVAVYYKKKKHQIITIKQYPYIPQT